MSLTPQALRLLSREMVALRSNPPEGVRIVVDEEDLTALEGWVQGPSGTPYEGGYFRILFNFGPEYPNAPPKCTMATKIFHPNISKSGEICVDTLKRGWKKEYGVGHVLVTIKCLLIYPNPESALDEEAGKQLLADYDGYSKYAKLMTSIHATPKLAPAEFRSATSGPSTKLSTAPILGRPLAGSSSTVPVPASSSIPSSSSKPAPLQTHAKQEQSPNLDQTPTFGGDKLVKPPVAGAPTKAPVAKAKPAAKRGLKRL